MFLGIVVPILVGPKKKSLQTGHSAEQVVPHLAELRQGKAVGSTPPPGQLRGQGPVQKQERRIETLSELNLRLTTICPLDDRLLEFHLYRLIERGFEERLIPSRGAMAMGISGKRLLRLLHPSAVTPIVAAHDRVGVFQFQPSSPDASFIQPGE